MNEEPARLFSGIPQVFFDIIGRTIPGIAIFAGVAIIFPESHSFAAKINRIGSSSTFSALVIIVSALVLAYVVGILLGGIGYLLHDHDWKEWDLQRLTRELVASPHEVRSGLPLLYDAVCSHAPEAGRRIAKLNAEVHLCRVLMWGSILITSGRVLIRPNDSNTPWLSILTLAAIAAAAWVLMRHLYIRRRTCLVNTAKFLCTAPNVPGAVVRHIEMALESLAATSVVRQ
ncbi:MAG: hypothetical protein WD872_05235 [Pirellulaceae bacterium]